MKIVKNKKNPINAPLYDCVLSYKRAQVDRFHMPGHKAKSFSPLYDGSDFDITELDISDNLLSSNGVILDAERLIADFYGKDKAYMFTCGATMGIYAALYVAKRQGGKILLSRNSHKSVFNALSILGIEPCFCDVEYDEYGFPLPVSYELLEKALKNDQNISTVLITTPDYFGRVCSLEKISELCKDKLLIGDSSHGAHFAFTKDLVLRAEKYCDICILSMHKSLPCFTGSAVVLCNEKYSYYLSVGRDLFHTTSPYYPALCSMDYTRATLSKTCAKMYTELKSEVEDIDRITTYDYCKLLLRGGAELDAYLKERGVYSECVFGNYLLLIVTPWDIKALKRLKKLLKCFSVKKYLEEPLHYAFDKGEVGCSFCDTFAKDSEYIDLEDSCGRIAAKEIGLYPPGVPLVIRGEIISKNKVELLIKYKNSLFGVDSGRVSVLK